jgi:hypothetical protein
MICSVGADVEGDRDGRPVANDGISVGDEDGTRTNSEGTTVGESVNKHSFIVDCVIKNS